MLPGPPKFCQAARLPSGPAVDTALRIHARFILSASGNVTQAGTSSLIAASLVLLYAFSDTLDKVDCPPRVVPQHINEKQIPG